jgi:hypothetical protein
MDRENNSDVDGHIIRWLVISELIIAGIFNTEPPEFNSILVLSQSDLNGKIFYSPFYTLRLYFANIYTCTYIRVYAYTYIYIYIYEMDHGHAERYS